MTHPLRRAKQVEIEARRARVASLLLAGVSDQSKIAEQVGVDRSTISRDIKVIEADWQASAVQDIAAAKGKDLQRIDRAIQAIWAKVLNGNERAIQQFVALLDRRAKLLGLNAPEKREHTGKDGAPIEHVTHSVADMFDPDEIAEIAERLIEKRGGAA